MDSYQTGRIVKPPLRQWKDAQYLDWKDIQEQYKTHVNSGFFRILKRLGYDSVRISSAEDMYYVDASGRKIMDCWGGFGALNLGHNHPRLAEVRRRFDEEKHVEICHAFLPSHATILAENVAAVMPEGLDVCYFCCTGSEAVESALKLAEKYKRRSRGTIVYTDNAMHGKTHGALSVTGNEGVRDSFKLLSDCRSIPYGDASALRAAFESQKNLDTDREIIAVILEPIQSGGGVVVPPDGYLGDVRQICDEFGAVLIFDEVQTGMGRTGTMFAFEYEGIVPDIVVLSKSLGGGKAPIAACVANREIFKQAYGNTRDCVLHNSTFSGMGCCAALATETMHVLYDENLIENAAKQGTYFLSRLKEIHYKYSDIIADVRGRGLLIGVEFKNITELLPGVVKSYMPQLNKLGQGALVALVAGALLYKYDILAAFTDFNRNVMRFEPPLTMKKHHVDEVVEALDEILSKGIVRLVTDTMKTRLLDAI
ncbi:MAG: aspartate aminotransferase family protein [Deltaproteobacteria bacterium]|nr:aspartate aminotransferase family protein [Deltaproteobacteria bacterium]